MRASLRTNDRVTDILLVSCGFFEARGALLLLTTKQHLQSICSQGRLWRGVSRPLTTDSAGARGENDDVYTMYIVLKFPKWRLRLVQTVCSRRRRLCNGYSYVFRYSYVFDEY